MIHVSEHPVILSVDVGTSGTKVLAVDASGRILNTAHSGYAFDVPQPGWSEQDPLLWFEGTLRAMRSVLVHPDVDADEVVGISLAGQMHGLVALDADREVVRPAMLWNDQRSAPQCERCLLYTSPSPRDGLLSRMPSSA